MMDEKITLRISNVENILMIVLLCSENKTE